MRSIWLVVSAVLFLSQNSAFGATESAYLSELVERSRQLRLSERPEWRKLVHYVPSLISPKLHSLADSPEFFNAPDGKTNPQSELEATLAAFYSDIEETNDQQNPQCKFIARYTWLDQQLGFDRERLPQQPCKRFQEWHAALNPGGLTFIFASAYLNSPSSMYGHTFIRVDAKDQNEHTRLLAYAVNFTANTNETNGLVFALNGLIGGYPGMFSLLPYYAKVREYSDLENRDVWEYELDFSPKELDRILMHAWELGSVYFQYFFFDENCAYHLLALLEVARPELDLTSRFRWWAIPSDSVHEIVRHHGLVRKAVYRPANATVLAHRLSLLDKSERKLAKELGTGRRAVADPALATMPADRAAAVLESSHAYVSYRRAIGKSDVAESGKLMGKLLAARSTLDVTAKTPANPAPATRPDQGHGSSRFSLGLGYKDGQSFQELGARATYHDIMDAEEGYARGAQIEFFNLGIRHYESGVTRIEKLTPLNILSLTPRDDFFQPVSWKVSLGWRRMLAADGTEPLPFALDGGAGGAWSNNGKTALVYAFLEGSSRFSDNLEKGYALGTGLSMGALFDFSPRWRVHGYARNIRYQFGQRDTSTTLGLEQRVTLGRNSALRLDIARNLELEQTYDSAALSLLFYF